MDQRADQACGAHNGDFDYTCDDCMLPANHKDPEEINNFYPMIIEITKKEYTKEMTRRKRAYKPTVGDPLFFKGYDEKYYRTSLTGLAGTREIAEFIKNQKKNIDAQRTLF